MSVSVVSLPPKDSTCETSPLDVRCRREAVNENKNGTRERESERERERAREREREKDRNLFSSFFRIKRFRKKGGVDAGCSTYLHTSKESRNLAGVLKRLIWTSPPPPTLIVLKFLNDEYCLTSYNEQ